MGRLPAVLAGPAAMTRNGGELGKADMHLHTLYSDGTASVRAVLDHVERAHRSRPHRDHRPRAHRRSPARRRDPRRGRLLVRPRHRRGDHDPSRPPPRALRQRADPGASAAGGDDRARPRPGRHRDRPARDGAAHPVARPRLAGPQPRGRSSPPARRARADEPVNRRPIAARGAEAAQRRGPWPGRRRQLRRPRAGGHRHRVDVVPRLERGRLSRGDRGTDDAPRWDGTGRTFTTSTSTGASCAPSCATSGILCGPAESGGDIGPAVRGPCRRGGRGAARGSP